jgi:hypothetical protein
MTLGLVSQQILMVFIMALIITSYPEGYIYLKGQMARLNLNGMAMGMF